MDVMKFDNFHRNQCSSYTTPICSTKTFDPSTVTIFEYMQIWSVFDLNKFPNIFNVILFFISPLENMLCINVPMSNLKYLLKLLSYLYLYLQSLTMLLGAALTKYIRNKDQKVNSNIQYLEHRTISSISIKNKFYNLTPCILVIVNFGKKDFCLMSLHRESMV